MSERTLDDERVTTRALLALATKACESHRLTRTLALAELRELGAMARPCIVSPRARSEVLDRLRVAEERMGSVLKAVEERAATLERLALKVGR